MGLIKQTASEYYGGEVVYTPSAANVSNALTWPNSMPPLIWDANITPTSLNNYKVLVNNIEQTPETSPYFLTQSLATQVVSGVQTQVLTVTSQSEVLSIAQSSVGNNYQPGTVANVTGGNGNGLQILINNINGDGTIYLNGSGYQNGDIVTVTGGNGASQLTLTVTATPIPIGSDITVRLINSSLWDNYKNYQYVNLKDIINNFIVAYVGMDKLIPRVKRSDVMFHAKRGLQEFSYDTLRSIKSQELTVPPNLSLVLPQDYVNYVQLSWVDGGGVKHIIYPTTLTSNPTFLPIQDDQGIPTQDIYGNNLQSKQSLTNGRWRSENQANISGDLNVNMLDSGVNDWQWWKAAYGQRYGLEPETTQKNGWFTIDQRRGVFAFSSNLANKLIILEYISDGLAYDLDTQVPKMAEQALYMYMVYGIISTRANFPEYIINRYKREKSSTLRNAKIRLSNIKLEEFTQVMRGKSKWIKH
jgi:hypothetical protein